MWRDKKKKNNNKKKYSNFSEMWETGSNTCQNECVIAESSPVSSTHRFFWCNLRVKKRHSLTFKCKITTSANYTDGIGTGYMYVSRQRNMSALNKT